MASNANGQTPEELNEFEGRSGEAGSEFYNRASDSGGTSYGTADNLQSLADGYFGLNWVFLFNIFLVVIARFSGAIVVGTDDTKIEPDIALAFFIGTLAVTFFAIWAATLPLNKKIGKCIGWSPFWASFASVLMGLNSVLCCGIIGYIFMQMRASTEMNKYGFKMTVFGFQRHFVQAKIEELRLLESSKGTQS